jgi:hypothetical protein
MRKTKNITVAVSERSYFMARVHAAQHKQSVSSMVQFILEHLPMLSPAIRKLREENYDFNAEPASRTNQMRHG